PTRLLEPLQLGIDLAGAGSPEVTNRAVDDALDVVTAPALEADQPEHRPGRRGDFHRSSRYIVSIYHVKARQRPSSPVHADERLAAFVLCDPVRAERALEEDLEGGVHRAAVLEEPDREVQVDRLVDADEERVVGVVACLLQALDPPLGDALALVLGAE